MKLVIGFNDIRQDGMGSAALNLLKALRMNGIKVQPIHSYHQVLLPEYYDFNPVFLTEGTKMPLISEVYKLMIEVINSDIDCTHFTHFGSPNWGAIVPFLRPDIKVVVSVHSITPSARKIALANSWRTSKFVPVSWEVENKLKRILPRKDHSKISRVLNAVDGSSYLPKTIFASNGKVRILFFGRIEDYTKGVDKIPKIARILKRQGLDFEWDLYGYFHLNYEDRFYKSLDENDVKDVVNYKGCLTPAEIPEMLPQYDIMVMPSNHEGLPIALLEALASGLTCIASKLHNVTDKMVLDGKEAFLVQKNDIDGFADAILKTATNIPLRKEIGFNAREKVLKYYSLEIHGREYLRVLEEAQKDSQVFKQLPVPETFDLPSSVQPHILARLLPDKLKRFLKKYMFA